MITVASCRDRPPGEGEPQGPRERPMIFGAASVRCILSGDKTQTRRVLTPQYPADSQVKEHSAAPGTWIAYTPDGRLRNGHGERRCPYGMVGDRLWVREAFALQGFAGTGYEGDPFSPPASCHPDSLVTGSILYRADQQAGQFDPALGLPITVRAANITGTAAWRSPLFMPRWASRLTLEITAIRAERLQAITEVDALAEGMRYTPIGTATWTERQSFAIHWDQLNKKRGYPWAANPWCWVVDFRRVEG